MHTVLPAEDQEAFIKHYLISAFALKLLDIVVLILGQVTVDIFLLDWERPPSRVEKLEKVNSTILSKRSLLEVIKSFVSFYIYT